LSKINDDDDEPHLLPVTKILISLSYSTADKNMSIFDNFLALLTL